MKLFNQKQSIKEIVSDMKVSVDNMSFNINKLCVINDQQLKQLEEMSSILNRLAGDKAWIFMKHCKMYPIKNKNTLNGNMIFALISPYPKGTVNIFV